MNAPHSDIRRQRRRIILPVIVGVTLFVIQLTGQHTAGPGYGLLFVAVILLITGLSALAVLVFTTAGETRSLCRTMRWFFILGGWTYVLGVFYLSGHYAARALAGQIEMKWILFGPTALAAIVLFDLGVYKVIYSKNRPTWERFRQSIKREDAEPAAMRRTFLADVALHTNLRSVSGLRWLRHTLIYWGFALLFAVEVAAVFVREGVPAFGWTDIWEIPGHPVRLAFDFAFEFFSLMVLLGCLLAFFWRIKVGNSAEKKYADTPSALFLFAVVVSGFILEASRIAVDEPAIGVGYSFVGWALASMSAGNTGMLAGAYTPLWYLHVFGSLGFIIYIPAYRLVHSCATPIGRLMGSQKKILNMKREHSLRGLMSGVPGSMTQKEH